jgi:hypothetical protein
MNTKSTGIDTEMVPFEGAQSILANAIRALATEQISLSDALGRIAAETIVAEEDLVPYDFLGRSERPSDAHFVLPWNCRIR